ncbi:hypothetical protein EDD36DRAFT_421041 [Exophiala viscosa]|uniref:Transmembrane protein n=1 Tax=Exophiala viscosa TaxID=2486360 RepID=A0AAN6IB51_9EURO|nr:hypothetical protein EDD36DRAFT_421041 [Exophiala viscosa]
MHLLLRVLLCFCTVVLGHHAPKGSYEHGDSAGMAMLPTPDSRISEHMSYAPPYDARTPGYLSKYPNDSAHGEELGMNIIADRQLSSAAPEMTVFQSHFMDLVEQFRIEAESCPSEWTSEPETSSRGTVGLTSNIGVPMLKPTSLVAASVSESMDDRGLVLSMKPSRSKWWYAAYPLAANAIAVTATVVISVLTISFIFNEMSDI